MTNNSIQGKSHAPGSTAKQPMPFERELTIESLRLHIAKSTAEFKRTKPVAYDEEEEEAPRYKKARLEESDGAVIKAEHHASHTATRLPIEHASHSYSPSGLGDGSGGAVGIKSRGDNQKPVTPKGREAVPPRIGLQAGQSPVAGGGVPLRTNLKPGERAIETGVDRVMAVAGQKDESKLTIVIRKEFNDPANGWTPLPVETVRYTGLTDWSDKTQVYRLNKWRAGIFHRNFPPWKSFAWVKSEKRLVQQLLREGLTTAKEVAEEYQRRMQGVVQPAGEETVKGHPRILLEDRTPPVRKPCSIKAMMKVCQAEQEASRSKPEQAEKEAQDLSMAP